MFLMMPVTIWPPKAYHIIDSALTAAGEAGVAHVVYSTSGAVSDKRTGFAFIDAKSAIARRAAAADVPVTLLQPSVFLENLLSPFSFPDVRLRGCLSWPYEADAPISWISLADAARHVVAALEAVPQPHRQLRIASGDPITGVAIARYFASELGRPVEYRSQPILEFIRRARRAMGWKAGLALAQVFFYHRKHGAALVTVPEAAESSRLLGLTPRGIGSAIAELLAPQNPGVAEQVLELVVRRATLDRALHYRGQLINMMADPHETGGVCCAWTWTCSRSLGPPVHIHTNEHEIFYVTKGTLAVGVDDRIWRAGPGEFVFLPALRSHWLAPISATVEMLGMTMPLPNLSEPWSGQGTMFRAAGTRATCLALPPYPDDPDEVGALIAEAAELGIVVAEPNPMMFGGTIPWELFARPN